MESIRVITFTVRVLLVPRPRLRQSRGEGGKPASKKPKTSLIKAYFQNFSGQRLKEPPRDANKSGGSVIAESATCRRQASAYDDVALLLCTQGSGVARSDAFCLQACVLLWPIPFVY